MRACEEFRDGQVMVFAAEGMQPAERNILLREGLTTAGCTLVGDNLHNRVHSVQEKGGSGSTQFT